MAGEAFPTLRMDVVADDGPIPAGTLERHRRAGRAWVAVDGAGRPFGHLVLDLLDGTGHVEQVTVHPDARGQRLGNAPLDAAREWPVLHASGGLTLAACGDAPPAPAGGEAAQRLIARSRCSEPHRRW